MSPSQFKAIVTRLEEYAQRNPKGYRVRVALLAALGYLYIWAILLIALALAAGLAYLMYVRGRADYGSLKLTIALLALIWMIARSMWIKFEIPDGVPITEEKAPRLFRMIRALSERMDAPRIHTVLVTDEFNASAVQIPRLGLLGWFRNYLLIGVPLMYALTPEQFRAVVAHEFGHFARAHGRFASWVYRLNATWERLLEQLQERRHWSTGLFLRFFQWYAPYFDAYTFVLRRANEYEADRLSAQVTSNVSAGSALLHVALGSHFVNERFYPALYQRADSDPHPVPNHLQCLTRSLREGVFLEQPSELLKDLLTEQGDVDDTHPTLSQRLRALGLPHRQEELDSVQSLTASLDETAAGFYLGEAASDYAKALEDSWREMIAPTWAERYQQAQEAFRRIAELEERLQSDSLSADDWLELATLKGEFGSEDEAIRVLRQLLAKYPDHGPAYYQLGTRLLDRDDAEGLRLLERAMELEPGIVVPACYAAYRFLQRHGSSEEADRYHERAYLAVLEQEKYQEELQKLRITDRMEPHDLTESLIDQIRQVLATKAVQRAYLVRRFSRRLPEPTYVLAVLPRWVWYKRTMDVAGLIDDIIAELPIPHDTLVIPILNRFSPFFLRIRAVKGALIYDRKRHR